MKLNSISYYHRLINELDKRDINIRPLSEIKRSSKPTVGLRHDIDNHPDTAQHMARYLAMKGLPGSFYLLHSAPYYTREKTPKIVYNLIVFGCEIGLHNDAWHYGNKGPRVIQEEIAYLRSLGVDIKGTVAHNSLSTYGAANYEVFKERVLLKRKTSLPLGKLSMKRLGLTYEGTFSKPKPHITTHDIERHLATPADIQSKEWMNEFLANNPYCDYETFAQFWLIGKDEWAISLNGQLYWKVNLEETLDLVNKLPEKTQSLFIIHPSYFEPTPTFKNEISSPKNAKKRWGSQLPRPIKRIGLKILQLNTELSKKRISLLSIEERWQNAQKNYVEWVKEQLPPKYLKEVILTGEKFSEYIGDPQRCLDIGCGNGLFGGKTYEEIGYSYLSKTPDSHIIGLDSLPLESSIPWLDEYKQGVAEKIPFKENEFDKIVIATSLDHVLNPDKCISECYRVLRTHGNLYIWTTYKGYTDKYHPHEFQEESLSTLLTTNGFKIENLQIVSDNNQVFVKATKNPEFDYQWGEIPSPATILNRDRIIELLNFTKLPPAFFKNKHCLDAGCGSGRFTWTKQELGAKVSSFDISPKAIEQCKKINPDAYVHDIYDLEPNPTYDFVLCWGVLHHLPTPETGFQKISTQVKQGGILHIMVYHKDTQGIYKTGRAQWPYLPLKERIALCEKMIRRHGGNLHGWWDAFNPKYNWSYTPKQIRKWFEKYGFTEIIVTQEKNINIRGVKK